jgi:superfamily I DNA/RNA helicase
VSDSGAESEQGAVGDETTESDERLVLVPVTLAKGLEFDHVVLVEPSRIASGETYGLRRLYVALTRAVSRITVIHAEPLPVELLLRTIDRGHWGRPIPEFFALVALLSGGHGGLTRR